ncbi:MAG: NAD-dependent epimerase/dehydratase family protein [Oscillospiraceae bacterium]|nr:NAD-dependent epimerase/dehydratase family protein [Oscillospiraceae bacterium]
MNILITGGTVFASRYTAEYFVKKGHDVYVLNRNSRPQSSGVKLICCDRHNLNNSLKDIAFDAVIDVTAYNEQDILSLTDGLGKFDTYIMISSSAVYPETNPQPFTETQMCGPNIHWGNYGTDKLAAEKLLLKRIPSAYIIRPPYLYGKMNNLYREAFVFECAEQERPFYIPDNENLNLQFFDIEDMCRLVEIIIEHKPIHRIYNVGNPNPICVRDWVKLCYNVVGKQAEILSVSKDVEIYNYFPFRNYNYFLDVTRQIDLMPTIKPMHQGIAESYQWYKSNKDLIRRKGYIDYINKNFNNITEE